MSRIRLYINFLIALITSTAAVFLSSCKETPEEGMIIVTQIAGDLQNNDYITGNSWRYFPDSRLVALNTTKSGTTLKILTEDFFSACSPAISYDGKYMLFAAQKRQNDIWQLWEMNLKNLKVRQIMSSTDNCIDPAYLPDGRLVFSKFSMNDTAKRGHPLYTCSLDGSEISQITYNPHAYFASSVLLDGRIVTISRELYPDQRDGMLMILRPDGSKEEMFYQGLNGSDLHSRARETNNGTIIFIERDHKNTEGGNIISVNYNSPLHTRVNLSSEIKGDFYNASPVNTDRLLVSYRAPDEARYGLYEFDSKNKQVG